MRDQIYAPSLGLTLKAHLSHLDHQTRRATHDSRRFFSDGQGLISACYI